MFNLDQKVHLVNILHYFAERINRIGNIDFFEKGVNSQEKISRNINFNFTICILILFITQFFHFHPICGKIVYHFA